MNLFKILRLSGKYSWFFDRKCNCKACKRERKYAKKYDKKNKSNKFTRSKIKSLTKHEINDNL